MPDEVNPLLATDLTVLRNQECDRVSALAMELAKVGAPVVEGEDWLVVFPLEAPSLAVSGWIKANLDMRPRAVHVDGSRLLLKT